MCTALRANLHALVMCTCVNLDRCVIITAILQSLNWGSFHTLPHMTVVTDVCVCCDTYVPSQTDYGT
jgi:hypothetical protein